MGNQGLSTFLKPSVIYYFICLNFNRKYQYLFELEEELEISISLFFGLPIYDHDILSKLTGLSIKIQSILK